MKTWVIAAVAVGVLVLAGLPALAVTLASNDDTGAHRDRDHSAQGPGRGKHHAGAPGAGRDKAAKARKAWKRDHRTTGPSAAWRSLTPAQKAAKMAELSREHAAGMQKWADCVAAGKDDCVKPLPPGLAKRR